MKLDRTTVENVAKLARLGLDEAELERMRDELAPILAEFEKLGEIDTGQIPPTAQVIAVQNLMRPDEARPSAPVTEVLVNAPNRAEDYFKVKAVFDKE
jgi:aspartyl-tRNA(Asn)/glutamyl-tRNA(Gln) amidotransferase subunit C